MNVIDKIQKLLDSYRICHGRPPIFIIVSYDTYKEYGNAFSKSLLYGDLRFNGIPLHHPGHLLLIKD